MFFGAFSLLNIMPSFKSVLFFLISLTLGVVFFLIISGRVDWGNVATSLSLVKPWQFFLLFILNLGILGAMTFSWREVLLHMGYKLPRRKLWRILIVGFTVSFLTPIAFIGGEALILYLLKRECNVPWRRGVSSLIIFKLADFILHIFFVMVGLMLFFALTGLGSIKSIFSFVLIPSIILILIIYLLIQISRKKSVIQPFFRFFKLDRFVAKHKIANLAREEKEIMTFFDFKKRRSWSLLSFTLLNFLITWGQAYCLLFFLTGETSVISALIIYSFAGLSVLFLLPATLGSLEFLQILAFNSLGFGSDAAVSFSLVWRGMRLLICALSAGYFFYFASKNLETKMISFFGKLKKIFKQSQNKKDSPKKGSL